MAVYGNCLSSLNEKVNLIGKTSDYGCYPLTNKKIAGINICIMNENDEVLEHLDKDYPIASKEYKKAIMEKFIPWLTNNGSNTEFGNYNDIKEDIKIDEITYDYRRVVAKYSPTNKDDYFGIFGFMCSPQKNLGVKRLFECSEFELYVINGKIAKVLCYDV